jgi:glycosyltransferase involved in cell wall biosynthesis
MRIAVVAQGDVTDPRSWSGTPAGICAGLEAIGVEPVPINARPPGSARVLTRLRRSWTWEATSPVFPAACGAWADLSIRRAGGVDGIVAIGSGYLLRSSLPTVSFDDMTVAQGALQPWSPVSQLPANEVSRWRSRQALIYQRSRNCCVCSGWTAQSVSTDYGVAEEKIKVVGLGRNHEPAAGGGRDWTMPRFLFIGIDWERKGGPAVLEAFAKVRARHPAATLDLVGGHPDSIEADGVTGHGRLSLDSAAEREQLSLLLADSTCMVLPSIFEAFGIAYVDAGAYGVPSIGTTVGGAADAIGGGGVLVDPTDLPALERAMLDLCDADNAQRLGARARANALRLTWPKVAERVLVALAIAPTVDIPL